MPSKMSLLAHLALASIFCIIQQPISFTLSHLAGSQAGELGAISGSVGLVSLMFAPSLQPKNVEVFDLSKSIKVEVFSFELLVFTNF